MDSDEHRMMKPRLMLVEHDVARRLEAVAALASRFDVVSVADGDEALRTSRARRPDVALLSVHPRHPDATFRLCRTLRTDVRPVPRVGVLDRTGSPRPPAQVMELWLVDGYRAGPCPVEGLVAFTEALTRGDRPVEVEEPRRGPISRLLGRLLTR